MYIVLEGMDFAGKSTLGKELAKRTGARLVMEPFTETQEGKDLKAKLVSNTMTMDQEIQGYALARLMTFREVVGPYIKQGKEVISDRNVLTSMCYQSDDIVSPEEILDVNTKLLTLNGYDIRPDIVFFVDITHETFMERLERAKSEGREVNNKDEMFRDKAWFERYRNKYKRCLRIMEYMGVEVHIMTPEEATLDNCLLYRSAALKARAKRLGETTESDKAAYKARFFEMV